MTCCFRLIKFYWSLAFKKSYPDSFQVTEVLTQLQNTYMVFDTSYNTLQTWIGAQTNKTVVNISLQQKTYVVV